jgi:hypothetical protein
MSNVSTPQIPSSCADFADGIEALFDTKDAEVLMNLLTEALVRGRRRRRRI